MARNERGLTLTEITVVLVLAGLVMIGLTGFYMNAQSTWLDGSSQAVSQREATLIVEAIRDSTHRSAGAIVDVSDPLRHKLSLIDPGLNVWHEFWWDPGDSLLHQGLQGTTDLGPLALTKIDRIQFTSSDSLVSLDILELRAPTAQGIRTSSSFAILNK